MFFSSCTVVVCFGGLLDFQFLLTVTFSFREAPNVADTTSDDFVSEAVVLNSEDHSTNTNHRHLTTKGAILSH